jgi:DNA polymerase-3 subunit delta'
MNDASEPDRLEGCAHPRETQQLVGHEAAQAAILEGLRQGRLHHAWLIGGDEGIGKATFAYQVAKLLLARKPMLAGDRFVIDPTDQASRLVAQLAHPDLVVLRRQPGAEKKGPTQQIPVDTVRRALDVFASTASGGGWRVCIVDSAEDLNTAGANALLKVVEEPPPRGIFLIVAHQPGRVLATIRSRCRRLSLQPLGETELRAVLAGQVAQADPRALERAVATAQGSVRRALIRLDPETAALIEGARALLDRLPQVDVKAVMGLGEQLAGRAAEADFAVFLETVEDWMSALLAARAAQGPANLAPLAELWDKIGRAARETEVLNLDRRPLVMSIVQDLADVVGRMRPA